MKQFVDSAALQFEEQTLVVVAGPARVPHNLMAACFSRLRGGFALFVSLVSVYVCLGFSMFKGVGSRWAWQSLPSFEKVLRKWVEGQVLRSMEYDRGCDPQADESRCLPFHAVSVFGLVVLLTRWAAATPRQGGLRESNHKVASMHLLEGLVSAASSGDASVIKLLADDAFEWRPPRPARGDHPFVLRMQVVRGASALPCLPDR